MLPTFVFPEELVGEAIPDLRLVSGLWPLADSRVTGRGAAQFWKSLWPQPDITFLSQGHADIRKSVFTSSI